MDWTIGKPDYMEQSLGVYQRVEISNMDLFFQKLRKGEKEGYGKA